MWGGRFSAEPDALMRAFSQSVSFDKRLYSQDIRGSIAHARMLRHIGILSAGELSAIEKNLSLIRREIEAGEFDWKVELEDVHMNIEAELTRRTPHGAKLHTGRSRNDQVATDMRLWLLDNTVEIVLAITALQSALVRWAEREGHVPIPGYTHLQRAQPVLLAHHLLAYVEMLQRDLGRFTDAAERAAVLPLGSGAIAGSTLPLDREFVARQLGFVSESGKPRVTANSMDAVSDRDFVAEFLFAASLAGVHLSRLSEDMILWSSAEFGFIRIGDAYTTGSSLMPQKKNPDVCELVRGKSARLIGNVVAALTLLKGLPMTYNRDLQEDKERLFDSADTILISLQIFAQMVDSTVVRAKTAAAAAADPLLLATDIADALVRAGVPFRQAHHIVGAAVALAEKTHKPISELSEKELLTIAKELPAAAAVLHRPVLAQLAERKMTGAPNPTRIRAEIKRWNKVLAARQGC